MASFEKVLSSADVLDQLEIPSLFTEHLPQHQGGGSWAKYYLPVHGVSGDVWENFGYHYVKKEEDYLRPVFQGDWCGYVRAKKLIPGDKIIFRVEENASGGAPRYMIAAKKREKLFGSVSWSHEF